MAQSQNHTVDHTIKATSFHGIGTYGHVMVGDVAFEFYNERNPEDYVQIPWDEVNYVSAEVVGKRITRFAIFIKGPNEKAHFSFSTRDNKATLRAVRDHIGEDKLFRSKSFLDVTKAGLGAVGRGIVGVFKRDKGEDVAVAEDVAEDAATEDVAADAATADVAEDAVVEEPSKDDVES